MAEVGGMTIDQHVAGFGDWTLDLLMSRQSPQGHVTLGAAAL